MNFESVFSEKNLKKIYYEKICFSTAIGIDKMNNSYFMKNIDYNIKKISDAIRNGKYEFKEYRIILIPKDVNVKPRKICVPTISDRIVIEALKDVIYAFYSDYNLNKSVSSTVHDFIECFNSKKYSYFIKTDLSSFFDNIDHKILLKKLSLKINDTRILLLLENVLKNKQCYNIEKRLDLKDNLIGVPQGLSISTLLANIYMIDLDKTFNKCLKIKYFRYVDDIFIYSNDLAIIYYLKLLFNIKKLNLTINKKKTLIRKMNFNTFEFLGYFINDSVISVKKSSIHKLEESLEKIFKNYYYSEDDKNKPLKRINELQWRLNIRISGAISNNKRYGWLFYFKNITDLKLLYHLDDYVKKLKKRYQVTNLEVKSFVESYYKMKSKSLKTSSYFFNVDSATDDEKRKILYNITSFSETEINNLNDRELDFNFKKAVFKCLKSLEKDLDSIS